MLNFQVGDTLQTQRGSATITIVIMDVAFFTMTDELCCNVKINRTVEDDEGTLVINHSIPLQELGRWLKDGDWQVQLGAPVAAIEEAT